MDRLLTAYGNTMMSIGIWFIKRGENYAQWFSTSDVETLTEGK